MTGNVSGQRRAKEQDGLGGLLGRSGAVERDVRVRFRLVGVGLLATGGDSEGDLYRSATASTVDLVRGGFEERGGEEVPRLTLAVDDDGLAELLGLGQAGQDVPADGSWSVRCSRKHLDRLYSVSLGRRTKLQPK